MDTNSDNQQSPPRSRLEAEVLEILQRTDTEPSQIVKFRSKAQRTRAARLQQFENRVRSIRLTSLHWLVGCVLLAVLSTIVDNSSPSLGKLLALGSIGCLIWVFVRSYRTPKESISTKRWRGRDIDFSPPGSRWSDRFRGGPKPPKR